MRLRHTPRDANRPTRRAVIATALRQRMVVSVILVTLGMVMLGAGISLVTSPGLALLVVGVLILAFGVVIGWNA